VSIGAFQQGALHASNESGENEGNKNGVSKPNRDEVM